MRFLRLFLRGLKDAYDQFVLVMVVSVLWWVCAVLIVPGPPATVALFRMMDPRNLIEMPEYREFFRVIRDSFRTSWVVVAFTLPLILVLFWNMLFFRGSDTFFAILVPLWLVMTVIIAVLMVYALATVAALESQVRNAFRGAAYLLVMWPFSSLLTFLLLALIGILFTVLVLPLILFGPGVFAAVVNRLVLSGYNVEVIDPNSPTRERAHEVERGVNLDRGIRGVFRRDQSGNRSRQRGRS